MVSTQLKKYYIVKKGNLPQVGVTIKKCLKPPASIWFPLISLNFHTIVSNTESHWHCSHWADLARPLSYCTLERPNLHWGRRDMLEAFLQLYPKIPLKLVETIWNSLLWKEHDLNFHALRCFPSPIFFLWDILGVNVFTASLHPIHCGPWLHDEGIILQPSLCWIQDFFQEDKAISTFLKNLLSRWHFGIHNSLHLLGRFVWKGIT